jgi:hypothetical protein
MTDDRTSGTITAERPRGQSVANPRRLRLGRDGRPLPLVPDDDPAA